MATDPNVGVPDVAVVHSADVRLRVKTPAVCERCRGEEWVDVQVGARHYVSVPCPTCCCPCGIKTGGGLCEACEAEDFLEDDYARKVSEGSR